MIDKKILEIDMEALQIQGRKPVTDDVIEVTIAPNTQQQTPNGKQCCPAAAAKSKAKECPMAASSSSANQVCAFGQLNDDKVNTQLLKRYQGMAKGLPRAKSLDGPLAKLDGDLSLSTFLVDDMPSSADIDVFEALYATVAAWKANSQKKYLNVTRWFDLVQRLPSVSARRDQFPLVTVRPVLPASAAVKAGVDGVGAALAKVAEQQQKAASSSKAAAAASPSSSAAKKQQQKKQQKKNGGKGKRATPAPAADRPDFARLNIVVGKIVKAVNHPNADTMYLEHIDMGGEKEVQVVSGLRTFISLDEFVGKRVLCLANLKKAKLRGVESFAMVLCASNADHTAVEVLTIDDSVAVGARVAAEGFEAEPDASLNPKHKVWDRVYTSKQFVVGDDGLVVYDGKPLRAANGATVKVQKSQKGDTIG
jgi:aminoacyl tRNA synthase complex-interacting multifunctional protein 1